jgi:hypothetical protein
VSVVSRCPGRTMAAELGVHPFVANCHPSPSTLYAMTGQREQACAVLAAAIALYGAMDMVFWLPQAETALAQVEDQ